MAFHHFVSAFHLTEFSSSLKGRRSKIWTTDVDSGRQWQASVRKCAGAGNYNEAQGVENVRPEWVETIIATQIENVAAPIIRRLNQEGQLPDDEGQAALLRYLALLIANNPSRRRSVEQSQRTALRFMAQILIAEPERFEVARADVAKTGAPVLGGMTREEMIRAVESDAIEHEVPTSHHVRGLGSRIEMLTSALSDRHWLLFVSVSDFIVGDDPIGIARQPHVGAMKGDVSDLGFVDPRNILVVPLGRHRCLVGISSAVDSRVYRAGPRFTAEVNGLMVKQATRQVYSASRRFSFQSLSGARTLWFPPEEQLAG